MSTFSWRKHIPLLVCACFVLGACGGKSDKDQAPDHALRSPDTSSSFLNMRPGPEDRMALPRLGFAWEFDPSPASVKGAEIEQIRFVVHVAGPSGEPRDTIGTWQSEAVMNLHPDFRPGECSWWVEAFLPDGSVLCSPRSHFTLVE